MQRGYEFRAGFAPRAVKAVARFIKEHEQEGFSEPSYVRQYVKWAVPQAKEVTENGKKILKQPEVVPFMWKNATPLVPSSGKNWTTKVGWFRSPNFKLIMFAVS